MRKIGLIGTGYWSDKHLQAWKRIPGVEVVALCNRSRDKLLAKGAEYGVPEERLFANLEDMLAAPGVDLDVVDIVTGPETHLPFVKLCAAAGKHVMCQKPFAPTLEEAREIVRVADEAGIRLMVTENWRWLQPFQLIKNVLDEGRLGRLQTARYTHSDYYTWRMAPDKELPQPFFRTMPHLLFYEMGAHWFDTWRFLFGEPKRLYAETKRISPYIVGEDSGVVLLGHDDFYGTLDMSWATRRDLPGPVGDTVGPRHLEQFVIEGDEGTLKMYTSGRISFVDKAGVETDLVASTELDHEESHYRLQSHFIDCLNGGAPFQTSGADNVRTMELIFGTYESASQHRALQFER